MTINLFAIVITLWALIGDFRHPLDSACLDPTALHGWGISVGAEGLSGGALHHVKPQHSASGLNLQSD